MDTITTHGDIPIGQIAMPGERLACFVGMCDVANRAGKLDGDEESFTLEINIEELSLLTLGLMLLDSYPPTASHFKDKTLDLIEKMTKLEGTTPEA